MAKKSVPETLDNATLTPHPTNPLIPPTTEEDRERGYRITKWGPHQNYECIYCQYSTLWLEKIQKHFEDELLHEHMWAYPSPPEPESAPIEGEAPKEPRY